MRGIAFRGNFARHRLSTIALAIGLLAGGSGTAFAQDVAPPGAPANPKVQANGEAVQPGQDQIVVTGSRVAKSTFDTPNPVTVLNSEDIQHLNLVDVGEIVAQMPSNSNFFAANNVGLGNFNVGAQLVNLRGLNPFFGTRTLTLVDTRRVVPTTTGGGVDVTLIPSMLVARTETVTGGASAIYGSDAVAGVVNIILDTKLDGLKAQADFSRTTEGDGDVWHGSAAWGSGFADGKGHIVVGAEYEKSDSIGICSTERDWCSSNYGMFTNDNFATNGKPHYIIGPNATSANTSLTGVLTQCTAFFGLCQGGAQEQFNEDGSKLVSYDPGLYASGAGFFGFRQGGDDEAVGAYDTTTLRPEVKRWSTLAHVTYEVAPSVTAFLEGSYARSEAVNPVANGAIGPYAFVAAGPNLYTGSHIVADNAFLTPEEAAFVGPNGANFGRNMVNVQTARNETNNSTWRIVGGLDGNFGNGWKWELYYEHGQNKNDQHLYHNVVSTFLNYALDAVKDGSGNIVCGVNIPGRINPNTGAPYSAADVAAAASGGTCVPLNLFGTGNVSQAAVDYAFRTLVEYSTYKQDVASLNVNGDLFDGIGAGSVKLATGLEYRHEYGIVTHDLDNQPWYNNYTLGYGLDYAGSLDVLEGYGELNVPVFKDAPVGKYFELDGAVRYTTNKAEESLGPQAGDSRRHDFVTWKLSGIWDVTDWLRLRATRSRDVRAAQFRELFQSYNVTAGGPFGSVTNPWAVDYNAHRAPTDPAASETDSANITTGGDVNLKPEVANTITAGIVLSPNRRLRFSADWYQIEINNAIVGPPFGLGAQNIVTQCYQGVQTFCDRMTGEGTLDILTIDNTAVNLQGFTTRGIDFEGVYMLPLGERSSLNFRVLASLLYDQVFNTGLGTDPINYAGQSGPTAAFGSFNTAPKWQGNAFITYTSGPFSGTVQARYVGPGRFLTQTASGGVAVAPGDPGYSTTDPNSISDNHVDSAVYMNLSASYDITSNISLFGSLNNVFDKDPAIAPGGNGYPTNPVYFDTYGRTWRVGVRVKM